jgi:beta-lactamase class A
MTATSTVDLAALEEAVHAHIDRSGAELGVCLRHVESGLEVLVHPDDHYPMASVFKIPVLIETLAQVDEGRQSLDTRIELRQEEKVLPSGILVELQPGLQPTLHDLLTLMIIVSDNTATDLVLQQIGIPSVEPRLRSFGCNAISLKMSVRGLFDATFVSPDVSLLPHEATRLLMEQGRDWECITNQRTLENNVASPRDMAHLLESLLKGELLSPESTRVALDILFRQQLNLRIPRFLPPTVPVAHKTGTFLQSRNDVGIIYLPDGTHLLLVTFAILDRTMLESDPLVLVPYLDRVDGAMGHIARSAYDAFTAGEPVPIDPAVSGGMSSSQPGS